MAQKQHLTGWAAFRAYPLRGAKHNLAVRLMYIQGKIKPPAEPDCELFESYRDMAQANGVLCDDPALEHTR